jgi:hypothetical protein
VAAREVARVRGVNYSNGDETVLVIYRFQPPARGAAR